MKEIHKINLLYDFYGSLLTERQQRFIELYYGDDLSLGEIAEQFEVTRQAVHDTLKRSEQILENYEKKLGLVAKFNREYNSLDEILNIIDNNPKDNAPETLDKVRNIVQDMLNSRQEV